MQVTVQGISSANPLASSRGRVDDPFSFEGCSTRRLVSAQEVSGGRLDGSLLFTQVHQPVGSSARPSNLLMSDSSHTPKTSRDGTTAGSEAESADSTALIARPKAEELSIATTTPADTVVTETVTRDTSPAQTTQDSTQPPTFRSQTWQSWSRTNGDGVVESDWNREEIATTEDGRIHWTRQHQDDPEESGFLDVEETTRLLTSAQTSMLPFASHLASMMMPFHLGGMLLPSLLIGWQDPSMSGSPFRNSSPAGENKGDDTDTTRRIRTQLPPIYPFTSMMMGSVFPLRPMWPMTSVMDPWPMGGGVFRSPWDSLVPSVRPQLQSTDTRLLEASPDEVPSSPVASSGA